MSKSASVIAVVLLLSFSASSQTSSASGPSSLAATSTAQTAPIPSGAAGSPAVQMMSEFKNSRIKFDLDELVDILRDRRHEGWVLAAYPDPRTGQPLIGAGFSLDLPEREHPQTDPLNPHPFLEPSSADLWRAAGFDSGRLDDLLQVFYERKRMWSKRTWRRHLYGLPPQISDEDATQLVRVGAIQAIYNARAYCRNFDQLTGPQQMALAQLVYQMGLNLQHFTEFLAMINSGAGATTEPATAAMDSMVPALDPLAAQTSEDQTPEYWRGVQKSLMGSQWAHKYRTRAIAVIAMLDPAYGDDPSMAEQRVGAVLRPAVHRRRHSAVTRQVAGISHHGHLSRGRTAARARNRKRA